MCDLLQAKDARIILVALNGLENILRDGKKNGVQFGYNKYAILVEEEGGLYMFYVFFTNFRNCT